MSDRTAVRCITMTLNYLNFTFLLLISIALVLVYFSVKGLGSRVQALGFNPEP